MYVSETDVGECLQLVLEVRHGIEELDCFRDRHVEHVRNRATLVEHFERFAVVTATTADVAWDVYVRQEVHLDLDQTVTLTGLAASALHIEAEATRCVATDFRFGQLREECA